MDLSAIGGAVLIAREGRRLTAYRDTATPPVWTIGIGCTSIDGRPVREGMTITAAECDALFARTLVRYVAAVNRGLTVPVAQHAFDALVSICFNIGIGSPASKRDPGFLGSTFLKRINAGDMAGARDAILMWKKPASIVARREAEAEQFVTPYAVALPRSTTKAKPIAWPAAPRPAPLDPPMAMSERAPPQPLSQPALTGGLSSAPNLVPAASSGGLLSRIAGRLRAAYPVKG